MGDRCFMQITCRRQDQARFEALGFRYECKSSTDGSVVDLIDEEANYAHYDQLPQDIPYHGYHGAGGEYGSHDLACDGQTYAEVESGRDGDYVVTWDDTTRQPSVKSLERIRAYLIVLAAAGKQLGEITEPPDNSP